MNPLPEPRPALPEGALPAAPRVVAAAPPPPRRRFQRARLYAMLYLLMVPTIVGTLLFTYLPNLQVVKYAFYKWDGAEIAEYRGLYNFTEAFFRDTIFWQTFSLVGILLLGNLVKMWPSIIVAIAIHRLRSQRFQYLYRVLFVVPMVIPGLVWLLIWKAFFTEDLLNSALSASGMMGLLDHLDSPAHGLPALAEFFRTTGYAWDAQRPLLSALTLPLKAVPAVFGGPWGLGLFGLALLAGLGGVARLRGRWLAWLALAVTGVLVWGPWLAAPLLVTAAAIPELLRRHNAYEGDHRTRWLGWGSCIGAFALVLLAHTWTSPIGAFAGGEPSWLGHSKLIIPSVLLWGFPWVGTIGVLIYLAGLSNISQDVYEAAELDGVGSIGRLFRIELPLIMSQVRINLIFLTIATLTDYGFFLILLGHEGGPDNMGLVPGLYMYQKAFVQNQFGYSCALGMIMFVIILALTWIYQRFVTVEK